METMGVLARPPAVPGVGKTLFIREKLSWFSAKGNKKRGRSRRSGPFFINRYFVPLPSNSAILMFFVSRIVPIDRSSPDWATL
jgi:hypothetical protein